MYYLTLQELQPIAYLSILFRVIRYQPHCDYNPLHTLAGTPGGINVKEITNSSIRFSFNDYAGATSYNLSIDPADADMEVYNDTTQQHTFSGLTTGRLYTISVAPEEASNPAPITTEVRTSLDVPGSISYNPSSDVGPNSITIGWSLGSGDFDNFELTIESATTTDTIVVSRKTLSQMFTGLEPETEYTIKLWATAGSGDDKVYSPSYSSEVISTLPTVIEVSLPIGETFLLVQWKEQAGDVVNYHIQYSPDDGEPPSGFNMTLNPRLKLISGLSPGQEYTITLFTVSSADVITEQGEVIQRTKPTKPGPLTVQSQTATSGTISWTPPSAQVVFDTYKITYSPSDGLEDSPIEVDPSTTELTLRGLTPGTTYDISVVTVSGELESAEASTVQLATCKYTVMY
ncbi:tenascin-N-like [Glandiceps talaboti]